MILGVHFLCYSSVGMFLVFQMGSHASENDYRVPQSELSGAYSREGRVGGQGWDKGVTSKTLALGARYKEAPKNSGIPINNILMQYFKKIKIKAEIFVMNKIPKF